MGRLPILTIAATVFVVQLVLAHVYPGFLTGDEVEVLSEALRTATDYEYAAYAGRNTLVARFIVAPWIWVATCIGITGGAALVVIATIPFALASALTIVLVHALASRWSDDPLAADAAAITFALHWLPLGFGSTTYPRVISMLCVTGAALLLTRGTAAGALVAGALMGVSFADRYSEGIYFLPLLLIAGKRMWLAAFSALISVLICSGVYEWVVWGSPFHSFRTLADSAIVQSDWSARAEHQPLYWYLANLPRWCAPALLPFLWTARRSRALLFIVLPIAALTLIAHKEIRFLQTVIPFLAVAAGVGFAAWYRTRRNTAIALLAISLAWNLWGLRFLGRETKPAVEAARFLAAIDSLKTIALGQVWAYGDRIYLGNEPRLIDISTPAQFLDAALPAADAVATYESDLTPQFSDALAGNGYEPVRTFRAPRARDVVVFVRSER
ncbi:MAG TPA: hypothetical protein VNA69_14055 [Thermoanaerobaculia bacterium]|nr:hypothetical protein [Thermoanaerobaculia bacterium]